VGSASIHLFFVVMETSALWICVTHTQGVTMCHGQTLMQSASLAQAMRNVRIWGISALQEGATNKQDIARQHLRRTAMTITHARLISVLAPLANAIISLCLAMTTIRALTTFVIHRQGNANMSQPRGAMIRIHAP
jgi:hypothetical protein